MKADKKPHGGKSGKSGGGSKSSKPPAAVSYVSPNKYAFLVHTLLVFNHKILTPNHTMHQMADLGTYGTFKMLVYPNGTTTYDVALKNLTFATVDELEWHLHSGKIGSGPYAASNGSATACGANFTAGHYDPMLKCGSASTAPLCGNSTNEPPCCYKKPASDYCSIKNIGSCEIGDLSGLYGKVNITSKSGELHAKGLCPDCIKHYMPKASAVDKTAVYNTWASVVFHGSNVSAGDRVLCADVKLV
jgi:hypothetical protein